VGSELRLKTQIPLSGMEEDSRKAFEEFQKLMTEVKRKVLDPVESNVLRHEPSAHFYQPLEQPARRTSQTLLTSAHRFDVRDNVEGQSIWQETI
jgi:hypothetical protein